MKIFETQQLKDWDDFTIQKEGISSFTLMDRASLACTRAMLPYLSRDLSITVLCGLGNNGGDGYCIASYLFKMGYKVTVYELEGTGSNDREKAKAIAISSGLSIEKLISLNTSEHILFIDALFGFGINRPLFGPVLKLINQLNKNKARVFSIDLPSGMPATLISNELFPCVKAERTFTIENAKLSFFSDDYAQSIGILQIVNIGLADEYERQTESPFAWLQRQEILSFYRVRKAISHKGIYGRSLIIAGNSKTGGAAILAANACINTGTGLTSLAIPDVLSSAAFSRIPEAMQASTGVYQAEKLPENIDAYTSICIGPGLGKAPETIEFIKELINQAHERIIWDADALNILSELSINQWPKCGIFTPHPREFDRLFGAHNSFMSRWETARRVAQKQGWHILLKGANSSLFLPDGRVFFHKGEIPALAKGGSGDVLSGMICSLLSQAYSLEEALKMGVYLHAEAAKTSALKGADESVLATDIIENISIEFRKLKDEKTKH